ncbi:MAG: hypothetical protein L6Q84_35965 [Polyangiaceae bacterium]|jgi:tetratricopeptide (TPR) repeat protein|nr:hypothetical protein [Polyangiaceae bacterium]
MSGADDTGGLRAKVESALECLARDEFVDAESMLQEASEACERAADDGLLALALSGLALAQKAQGADRDHWVSTFNKAFESHNRQEGTLRAHASVALRLAIAAAWLGLDDLVIGLLESSAREFATCEGAEGSAADAEGLLARELAKRGRAQEAVGLAESATARRRTVSPDSGALAGDLINLCACYVDAKMFPDAKRAAVEAIAVARHRFGAQSKFVLGLEEEYADLLR